MDVGLGTRARRARRVSQGCRTLGAGMVGGGGGPSASFRAASSSLALARLAAMAAWLSSAAFAAAFAYAAALFGAGYAGGGGTASGPCACLWATRLAAQSRAIAPMSPLPIIAADGCTACTGVSGELPHTPPVTCGCRAVGVVSERGAGRQAG